MTLRIFPLSLPGLPAWLARSPFALVVICDRADQLPPSAQAFRALENAADGVEILIGRLVRQPTVDDEALRNVLRTKAGPFIRSGSPPSGAYLFYQARVISHLPLPQAGTPPNLAWRYICETFATRIQTELQQQQATSTGSHVPPKAANSSQDVGAARPRATSPGSSGSTPRLSISAGPYAVLGIHASASDDEVRRAYREILRLNHPDRVRHMSEAIQDFAEARTRVILEAWDLVSRQRGMR